MIRRATHFALFALGTLLVGGTAAAQDMKGVAKPQPNEAWLRDSRYTNGEGFETDRYKLSPGIAAAIGYDSNLFLRSGSTNPAEPVTDAFVLSLTPFLTVNPRTTPTPPTYAFSATLAATYYEYMKAFNTAPGDDPSKFRNVGISAATKLAISPGRRWSGDLHAALHFHPLVFGALPLLAFFFGTNFVMYVRSGTWGWMEQRGSRLLTWLFGVFFVLLIVVWIARFFGAFGGPVSVE